MVITTIVNATTHVMKAKERDVFQNFTDVPSMQKFIIQVDKNAAYREFLMVVGSQRIRLVAGLLVDAAEIIVYETVTRKLEYRVSKMRLHIGDWTAFDAVEEDASSRLKIVDKSQESLVMLLKQVKICPAQCQNLVQTCLEGLKVMKEAYNETSEDDMWQLDSSKKLGQLISSLDKLLSTLGSVEDLLQACGSNWGRMALVASLPVPPPERMYSKLISSSNSSTGISRQSNMHCI